MNAHQDVRIGTQLPERRINAVDAEHIKQVALILRDPNPIHFDPAAAAQAGLGRKEVNQGGTTMAYVLDLLTEWSGSRSALRSISCSFRANIFAGDDVTVGGEVTAVSPADDGPFGRMRTLGRGRGTSCHCRQRDRRAALARCVTPVRKR
ncbi:MaoC/PaaZ C-terminal domain-containing protein [Nocardia africana]